MEAILKYPGGKWRIAEWIISFFPQHKVYCEPFFGSGAVFFKKSPAYIETINDINGDIVNLFRVCRENPIELSEIIALTPFAREEFCNCYERSENPIEQARRTLVRYHQSFGTTNSCKKSWRNVQVAGGPRTATMWGYLPETILKVCTRLKDAQIENIDALTLIERYDDQDTLLYLDPPYPLSLRKRNIYQNELSDEYHVKLLQLIKRSKSKIVISSYDNDLYNDMLEDWDTAERETFAQMGLKRVEKIWANFKLNVNSQISINNL